MYKLNTSLILTCVYFREMMDGSRAAGDWVRKEEERMRQEEDQEGIGAEAETK